MVLEARSYRLVLRKTTRGPVVQFRVSVPGARESTLVRMGGRMAERIFNHMAEVLKKHNLITEETKSENYTAYRLNLDIGPSVGGYLVMIRRSRNPEAWINYFEGLITEDPYKGGRAFLAHALHLSVELSKSMGAERTRAQLPPKVLDSVSAGFKVISKKLWSLKK
ncbi:hypothetical protein APE_0096.1 [Aeropyrum pernix K1]|uniref:Uncharacterized protein n=1 Tax=Aeropyrum pernix (strain ATCC 700893 / DSM 11879 / JCM 9820 / NBRC 100138 / K1) TaxID=272557 RepID=Q9YG05_AERPE|nr:hypothetical protein [Aeropyrum pernix]BAA79005.2 hypothetical protein APE_0096.1 [Aeropyrum pernix K1]